MLQPALPKYRVPVFREFASRSGIDFTLRYAVEGNLENARPDGFDAHEIACRELPGRLFWYPEHLRLANREKFDVVIIPWNTRHLSAFVGVALCRMRGVGAVVWGHGYSKRETKFRRWLRLKLGAFADTCVLYNYGAAYEIMRAAAKERVFVALNCLDQAPIREQRDAWRSDPQRLDAWRREQGVDPARTILFVSRLLPENGIELLIRAAAALRDRHPELVVAIVGNGADEARLRSLAEELRLGATVRFVGAIYEESQLAPWFLSARAFCYPQNIGLSLLHAFGYSLPAVTSDNLNGQNPEIEALRPGENGLTFPDGSVEGLTGALDRLLTDDELAARLSAGAQRTVEERFNLPWMVDGLEAAVRAAYARVNPRPAGSAQESPAFEGQGTVAPPSTRRS